MKAKQFVILAAATVVCIAAVHYATTLEDLSLSISTLDVHAIEPNKAPTPDLDAIHDWLYSMDEGIFSFHNYVTYEEMLYTITETSAQFSGDKQHLVTIRDSYNADAWYNSAKQEGYISCTNQKTGDSCDWVYVDDSYEDFYKVFFYGTPEQLREVMDSICFKLPAWDVVSCTDNNTWVIQSDNILITHAPTYLQIKVTDVDSISVYTAEIRDVDVTVPHACFDRTDTLENLNLVYGGI